MNFFLKITHEHSSNVHVPLPQHNDLIAKVYEVVHIDFIAKLYKGV